MESIPLMNDLRLHECIIIERTSLFTVKVLVNSEHYTAYINNTGRLKGVLEKGKRGYCIENRNGKLKYRIIGVESGDYASLIDTRLQEQAFLIAQRNRLLNWLKDCRLFKRNYKLSSETIDFAYLCGDQLVLVELKSAVMNLPGNYAGYPDAPTPRGRRQIRELGKYVERGGVGIVVFVAGIPRSKGFKLYCNEDKLIGRTMQEARSKGVLFKAMGVYLDPFKEAILLHSPDLPVDLDCQDTYSRD
ncbi:MAG: DNA/RNA nuclease SfsA [Desulfurococcaceae archaeon]